MLFNTMNNRYGGVKTGLVIRRGPCPGFIGLNVLAHIQPFFFSFSFYVKIFMGFF